MGTTKSNVLYIIAQSILNNMLISVFELFTGIVPMKELSLPLFQGCMNAAQMSYLLMSTKVKNNLCIHPMFWILSKM